MLDATLSDTDGEYTATAQLISLPIFGLKIERLQHDLDFHCIFDDHGMAA